MRKLMMVVAAIACLSLTAFSAASAQGAEDMMGKFSFGVSGGLSMPLGDLSKEFDPKYVAGSINVNDPDFDIDNIDTWVYTAPDHKAGSGASQGGSFNFGLGVDYFLTNNLAVGADLSIVSFKGKDVVAGAGTIDPSESTFLLEPVKFAEPFKASDVQFGVHGKFVMATGGPVAPYLQLGAGMYMRKIEISKDVQPILENKTELTDSKPGVNLGAGVDYKINEMMAVGINGTYHMPFGKFEHDFTSFETDLMEKVVVLKSWSYMTVNVGMTFYMPMGK
jgi:opacity protein-like surface antigen